MQAIQLQSTLQDIEELKQLASQSQRPRVQTFLKDKVAVLEKEAQQLTADAARREAVRNAHKVEATPSINYTSLTKYSYDQEGNKVKIILALDGIGTQCTADKIDVHFDKESVQVKIRDYNGQNLIFAIKRLAAEVVSEGCKYLVKTNMLSLTLIKKETKNWTQLHYKEEMFKPEKEETQDPNASLMNMMKKMYQQGDGTMKKTIAEAWTKANDKKEGKGGSMPGFD